MSHFWGSLKGELMQGQKPDQPGRVVVEGLRGDGILTISASHEGAIKIKSYYNEKTGEDWVRISKIKWGFSGYKRGIEREIYHGPIGKEG